jgi:uncharacterized phiE125 gp8 family phage protein
MWGYEMRLKLITAPTIEPVILNELKLHLRMDFDLLDEDEYLEALITTARGYVEDVISRKLLTQTWDYFLDCWPRANYIKLPFGNLQNEVATAPIVSWKDSAGTETTLTVATDYLVETNGEGLGRIVLPYAVTWPSGTLYPSNPITIRFVCGWTAANLIPQRIKSAVLLLCSDLYESRGEPVIGQSVIENKTTDRLLASCRLFDEF